MSRLSYTARDIAGITGAELVQASPSNPVITTLLTDSRRLVDPKGSLFIALVSERNDGHRYIPELYERGVRLFLVNSVPDTGSQMPDAGFLKVEDTLMALQMLAKHHREQFSIPVIGITGSNGKTVVKEWLYQLLSPDFNIVRSPKSYNSQVGVPLSVWKMSAENTLAIFEAGISQPGEMEHLAEIIHPTIGVFTNLGTAHDEHFTDHREKVEEKMRLFVNCERLVFCRDSQLIREALAADSKYARIHHVSWSRDAAADLHVTEAEKMARETIIRGIRNGTRVSVTIPFADDASVENAIHCWMVMIVMGYDQEEIERRMKNLTPIALRMEMKEAVNQCSLINDSYSSDISSLSIALDFLEQQNQRQPKTVILSDILQTGRLKEELYRELSELLNAHKISRIVGIGRDFMKHKDLFTIRGDFYLTTDQFLEQHPLSSFRDESILLKGARLFEFEKISQFLQQKAHETVMEINLDAMVHNMNHYRSLLKPGVKMMAMVKAFSYGSGSFEIANLLQFHHVHYLAVAYADEGVALRKAGVHLPIMVMSPEEHSLELLLKYNLEPEIYNLRILTLMEEVIRKSQTASQEMMNIHLKMDTGMHRLGFGLADLTALLERLAASDLFRVQSVFTHLAASEDARQDPFTHTQVKRFEEMCGTIAKNISASFLRHVLNSAGISRFPEYQFDMVRLGIGLYGVGWNDEDQSRLRNVSALRSVVTQIRQVPQGDSVGYNRSGVATRDSLIAVVPVGYADGLDRRLGNGRGVLYVKGKPAPVIGNICMDLTMIDITDLVNAGILVEEGDEVIVFDNLHPVSELAHAIGTIPYEVLSTLSGRVKRIYYHE